MKNRSVALLLETSNAYSRGLLDGIIGFVQQHRSWSVYLPEQERGADPPDWLRRWKGDGIIARIETDKVTVDILAKYSGVITKYHAAEGDTVAVGAQFVDIDSDA
jgi:LacI family transcriptional regulator